MSRPPLFDRDAVLDQAVALFWRRGYEATSIHDLTVATGLGRGSLYAAFADKRGLFEAALARYSEAVSRRTFAPLAEPGADLAAVEAVFARLATPDLAAAAPGCLVTNTACEAGASMPELRDRVRLVFDGLEARLAAALTRAEAKGQLAAGVDPRAAAVFLVAVAQGLRVLARVGEPEAKLETAAEAALAALRRSPPANP
jgi:TetR/AcrR family transcriptional repressor of nem operon